MRRFDPGYRAMRRTVVEEALGLPLFLHSIHRNAVAPHFITSDMVLTNSAVHELDISRFLLGEDFASVMVVSPRPTREAPGRQPQLVVLETVGGVVVDIEAFVVCQYGYEVRAELVCERGTVSLEPPRAVTRRQAGHDGYAVHPDWVARFEDAYREMLGAWVDGIRSGRPAGASAWDGYLATRTAEACLDALARRERVPIEAVETPALYR
jgi:myo-inositol 2-dehydrogenase/D-chiro-inositol 1-dehydrogenase